ncbi:Cytoplasmic dynein 1 intermediate chain 1 [Pelomyxa schiedti]|nr:Cytoplasmic dynein 1 intermediate chain 1 [Pelomyxa schiedti]
MLHKRKTDIKDIDTNKSYSDNVPAPTVAPGSPRTRLIASSILDSNSVSDTILIIIMWLSISMVARVLVEAYNSSTLSSEFLLLGRLLDGLHVPICINIPVYVVTPFCYFLVKKRSSLGALVFPLYAVGQFAILLLPPYLLRSLKPDYSPVLAACVLCQGFVFITKGHSYFMLNVLSPDHKGKEATSVWSYYDYMILPTLLWQPPFRRVVSRRWWFISKNIFLTFGSLFVLYIVISHAIAPTIAAFPEHGIIRTWLAMQAPCLLLFFLAFYGVLHCLLNLVSEMVLYADRCFYQDWWKATNFGDWTKKWNKSVQVWISSFYIMLQTNFRLRKSTALIVTFIVSSCWHDFILGICFKQLGFWTIGFMALLLIFNTVTRTKFFKKMGPTAGNVILWGCLLTGFPMLIMSYSLCLYYVDEPVCLPSHLYRIWKW